MTRPVQESDDAAAIEVRKTGVGKPQRSANGHSYKDASHDTGLPRRGPWHTRITLRRPEVYSASASVETFTCSLHSHCSWDHFISRV